MKKTVISMDLGGSLTRILINNSKNVIEYNSEVAILDTKDDILSIYDNPEDELFIYSPENVTRLARDSALRVYPNSVTTIDHTKFKTESAITISKVYCAIANALLKDNYGTTEVTPYIGIALPPSELYAGKANEFKKKLENKIKLVFPSIDNKSFKINILASNIFLYPEGIIARNHLDENNRAQLSRGTTYVIDIGHKSLDICPFKNGSPITKGVISHPIAGVKIKSDIDIALNKKGFFADTTDVFYNGTIDIDGKSYDVTNIINNAKQNYVEEILKVLNMSAMSSNIPLRAVNTYLLIGRPFNKVGTNGILISDILKDRLPGANFIHVEDMSNANIKGVHKTLKASIFDGN